MLQSLYDMLNGWAERIYDLLNVGGRLMEQALTIIALLPAPDGEILLFFNQLQISILLMMNYIAWLDWIIHIEYYMIAIGIMLSTESLLMAFRLWRAGKSAVPFV